jgi:release factor glutamine methyltransferase
MAIDSAPSDSTSGNPTSSDSTSSDSTLEDPSPLVSRLRAAGCVFAEDEARLLTEAARTPEDLEVMVTRRTRGLPLEQVLGWADFCGLRIKIDEGVFVPRRRTEFLASQAIAAVSSGAVVVDLCCGSGAVGAAIADAVDVELHASDIEPAAVDCARRNLPDARVYQGDLYDALPDALLGRVDVLVANVPYVPSEAVVTMPPEARDYEPLLALDGGPDGLDVARRVLLRAPAWLAPYGCVLVESSHRQASVLEKIMASVGLRAQTLRDEEIGATIVLGRL